MASTLVKVYVHVMFHVKTTGVPMQSGDLPRIFSYLAGVVRGIGGVPVAVGGIEDHVHILSSLPKTMSLSDFVKNVKTESSKWLKTMGEHYQKFAWQDGYGAFSVSSSVLAKTQEYIMNQAAHHKTRSFDDEYRALLKAYGIDFDEKYAFTD